MSKEKLYKSYIQCKNTECDLFDKRQWLKYKNLDLMFGANAPLRQCKECHSKNVLYSSAEELVIGLTIGEVIQILSKCNPEALFVLDTEIGTCENGTCYDWIENYVYDIFEYDKRDKVKVLYSSNYY